MDNIPQVSNANVNIDVMVQVAKISGEPSFVSLMQDITSWELSVKNINITCIDDLKKTVDSLSLIKQAHNKVENLRLEYVAFPTKYTRAVNGLFKSLKLSIEKLRKTLDYKVLAFKAIQEKEREESIKKQEELKAAGIIEEVPIVKPKEGEIIPVDMNMEEPAPLDDVVEGENGSKIYTKKEWDYEIKDFGKFTRAVGSIKTHTDLLPEELFDLKRAVLLKLIRRDEKPLRKIPGLRVYEKRSIVHR